MTMDVEYIGGKYITVIANGFPYRRSIRSILEAAGVEHKYIHGGTDVGEVGNTAITNFIAPSPEMVIDALKNSDNRKSLFGYIYDYKIDYVQLLEELKDATWEEKDMEMK